MGKTTHLAVGARGFDKIEMRKGVRFKRTRRNAEMTQQMLADQVRYASGHVADAQIDIGLTEMHGQQLCVTIGQMQQAHVAKSREIVKRFGAFRRLCEIARERHSARSGNSENMQKFTAAERHG